VKSFKDFITERHKGLDYRPDGTRRVHRNERDSVGVSNATNPNMKYAERIVPHAIKTKAKPFAELSPGGSIAVGNLKAQKIAEYFQSNLPLKINEVKRFKSSGYSLTRTQNGFVFKKDSI